jgi:bla regulator protein blaR1
MIPNSLSGMWEKFAPALGDHLWQSTLVAIAAGLLTLALRKNHARARYWLWLAASLKFLVPFSSLVAIGTHLSWLRGPAVAKSALYFTMEEVSQPFSQSSVSVVSAIPNPASSLAHWLPAILAGVWLCGFLAVILVWCVRWRRISADIRGSVPLCEGREVDALRRAEHVTGIRKRVEMLLSRATLEPGIFGMARPVLVWPEGISEHLETPHLEAIIAHELWHVRRRDNLAAVIHMFVEAIFWFHPLVWWLGARLVDERERACDEQVLELGSERQVYAESILKVCEFCVGSPLACVSGVTGADLKKRMVHIMTEHVVRKLDFSRKLLLTAAALVAIAAPIVFGVVNATPSRAQSQDQDIAANSLASWSVSIKPSELSTPTYAGSGVHSIRMMFGPEGFTARNVTLRSLIQEAYGVQANQITGGPEWLDSAAYNVEVKAGEPSADKFPSDRRQIETHQMLQAMLAGRAKLTFHHETKQLPSYALVVAENGPKLQPAQTGNGPSDGVKGPGGQPIGQHRMMMRLGGGQFVGMAAQGTSVHDFADQLSRQLGSAVVDKTGLKGNYDFNLQWAGGANGQSKDGEPASDNATASSNLATAIQEQLGLKLEPQTASMDVLVIDHIEQPTEN